MKLLLNALCLFLLMANIQAQPKPIIVSPGQNILHSIPKKDLYAHNDFTNGVIHYKSGKTVEHRMNYNILFDQMEYINSYGDTLILDDTNFDFVAFERDTFFLDGFFFRTLKDYGKIRLVTRNLFSFVNRQKNSAGFPYDSYVAINKGAYLRTIVPKDTLRFITYELYYMADVKNKIQTLHRENLIELYPHRKKALLNYLMEHTVSLDNLDEVEKMLDFITAKKYN
jgi:hypothetical protein